MTTDADARRRSRSVENRTVSNDYDVHFIPDYTPTNPYQRRLADALAALGDTTTISGCGGAWLPLLRAVSARDRGLPDILHVHFLHQFVVAGDPPWLPSRLQPLLSVVLAVRTLFELTLLRGLGVSLVWTAHDVVNHERRTPRVERAFKHVALRWLIDETIVHCSDARSVLDEAYHLPAGVADGFSVIPHGTYVDQYADEISRTEARRELGLPENAFVYGFFGSIREYKNVPQLVETFREVADGESRLVVAGQAKTEQLENRVRAAVTDDDRIHTALKYIPDDEVQVYMKAVDVIVLPFRTEGVSMLTSGSVLLAMSFARPGVAPAVGCVPETVGDGGLVYDGSHDGFRDAVVEIRGRPRTELERMGRSNLERALEWDWNHVAESTHRVYERTVEGSSE